MTTDLDGHVSVSPTALIAVVGKRCTFIFLHTIELGVTRCKLRLFNRTKNEALYHSSARFFQFQ
jgi:hypothetical protein